jgi:hypothetical protein
MRAPIIVLLVVGSGSGGVATSARAQAAPPCAQFDVCQYMPNPYNNGPLMPTWELPGNYGVGSSLTVCDPRAYRCYPAVPGIGF